MRKIIVWMGMSLDGFMAGPDGEIDWHLVDDELHAHINDGLRGIEPAPTLPSLKAVLREAGGWAAALRDGDVAARREVLAVLVDRVSPVRLRRGQYGVEIVWTPLGEALQAACSASVTRRVA